MIVVRVEKDREGIRFGILVAACELPCDAGRIAVVHPRRDVQRRLVVGDAELGRFRDRRAFIRIALDERGDGRRAQPDLIVQKTIDDDRRGGTD